jgi:prepilin-type processing-associated H-X9-DG protein
VIVNGSNAYWQDFIMPYVSKTGRTGRYSGTGSVTRMTFEEARNSVMWGCPAWPGWPGQDAYTFEFGISRFENGYSMNVWPTCEPNHPVAGAQMPPPNETQMRWAQTYEGQHHKITKWTKPAERMLLVDSNLWLLCFLASPGPISPQYATRKANDLAGSSNIDRYRHGKVSRVIGSGANAAFDLKGGRVGFNILYVDGHAATVSSYLEGYKAIRMRYPK